MACTFNLKDSFIPNTSSGGEWELLGFSLIESGPFLPGGNWPWSTNANENPSVNVENVEQGFYKLNYFVSGNCGGSKSIVVPIMGGGDAGITKTINICTSSPVVDIPSELGSTFDGGVLEPLFAYIGDTSSPGFIVNNPNTPMDNEFDPSLAGVGTYMITLNITPQTPSGYELNECCVPTSATLIINISSGNLQIAIDNACNISLIDDAGCESATYELYKSVGGTYVATGVTSLPYQVQENADWKLVGTGCDCGDVESNIVDSAGCCSDSTIQIHFDSDFCSIGVVGSAGCVTGGWLGQYRWYKSCDGGITWVHQPQHNDLDFITISDSCDYQMISICNNGCQSYSNIVSGTCGTGCSGALGGTQLSCVYRVATGLFCDGGTLKLIKVGTGVVATQILSLANNYPVDFPITSDGDFYVALDCDDGCPDRVGPTFTYAACGTPPPSCNSVISAIVTDCTITASVTNCPSPTYTFKKPDGTIAYSGQNNSWTGDVTGNWTIEADGCPDCGTLTTTAFLPVSCEGAVCNCIATITENNCAEFSLLLQSCSGYDITWRYRLDSGEVWTNVQTGGLSYNGTLNGDYSALLEKSGCPDEESNIITVSCFGGTCDCDPDISLDVNDCEIDITLTGCSGYTTQFQELIEGAWYDIGGTNPSSPYTPSSNSTYRLKAFKSGCPTVYSDPVVVNCLGGGCQVNITLMEVVSGDCSKVRVEWDNAGGSDVSVQWSKATVNTVDCNNAGGWQVITGTGITGSALANGTGFSEITLGSDDCDTCIRAIVDGTNEGCGSDLETTFAICCCTDNPTIDEVGVNATYEYFIYDTLGVQDKYTMSKIVDQSYLKITGEERVYRNGVLFSSTPFDHNLTGQKVTRSIIPPFTLPAAIIGDYYISVQFGKSSDNSLFDIPLGPTTAVLTGSGGTTTAAELTFNGDLNVWSSALEIAINNYLGTQGLTTQVECTPVFNKFIKIDTVCLHNATGNYCGIQDNDYKLVWNSDGTTHTHTNNGGGSKSSDSISFTEPSPCGDLGHGDSIGNNEISGSSHNVIVMGTDFDVDYNSGGVPKSITCGEHVLTVQNYCVGATFVWSNGGLTDSITVTSGEFSVVVTCPDGCEYILNITV